MLNSLAILSCRIWIEKSAKTFGGRTLLQNLRGEQNWAGTKQQEWRFSKLL